MDIKNWIAFLAALLFLEAPPSAEACTCVQSYPQEAFCRSPVVLRVKFLKAIKPDPTTSNDNTFSKYGYEIQTIQLLKGNPTLQNLTFISSNPGSSCAYQHPTNQFNTEYLIAGSSSKDGVSINVCSFKTPWSKLTPKQIQGLQGGYQRGCTCDVINCFYQPCSSTNDQCVYDDFDGNDSQDQHEDQICARNTKGICGWEKMQ